MAKIEFGWFVPILGIAETSYVPLAIAQQAEILPAAARHFDSLWVPDHFYAYDNHLDPFLECWTTITWLAARFSTVRVGQLVLAVGYRNPALLAKMAATLHALSGGRLILGLGTGYREVEYRAYGYPFPATPVRVQQLDEAIQIIRRMWTEPAPTFQGRHFQIETAYCAPQPSPAPPILIGGAGEQLLLPLVAQRADIWDYYHFTTFDTVDVAAYRRKWDVVRRHAEAAGRDPAAITQSVTIGQAHLPESAADGERWRDHLRPLVALGVRQFILDCGHVASTEPIDRFAAEVLAPLQQD